MRLRSLRTEAARPQYGKARTFRHDGLDLIVKQTGDPDGRLHLLVHGIGVADRYFDPLAKALGRTERVVVVQLPGMGKTPKPSQAVSIERYGGLLTAWLRSDGAGEVVVIGHSMGTQVAVELGRQAPDAVAALVLIGSVTDPAERSVLKQALRLGQDSLRERPDLNWIVLSDYVRCGPRFMLKEAPVMVAYPMSARAALLSMPVLLLRGEHDPISRPRWNRELAEAIPHSRLRSIPHRAHACMYSAADMCVAMVADFMRKSVLR